MAPKLTWLSLAVGLICMVLLTSCGGNNSAELEEIRSDLDSLRQDVDSLRVGVPVEGTTEGQAAQFIYGEPVAIATATAQLQDDVAGLTDDVGGQEARLEQLAADVAALSESRSDQDTSTSGEGVTSCSPAGSSEFTLQLLHASEYGRRGWGVG